MARYTTLSPTELAHIVAQYPIGTSLKLEEIPGGFGNSNFKLITTDGKFLLKICDEKDSSELNMQIALLQHLRQYAYPTVYPILTTNQKPADSRGVWKCDALSVPTRRRTATFTEYTGTTR